MSVITVTQRDGSTTQVESNDAAQFHGADVDGVYLGLVSGGAVAVPGPPPTSEHRWVGDTWVRQINLAGVVAVALDEIDRAAGAARMRYITSVPGQEATYLVKAEQARAYIAAVAAANGDPVPVPPYVQAETDATGSSPIDAANTITSIATTWTDVIGPEIERERIKAKRLVSAVEPVDGSHAALVSARDEISVLVDAAKTALAAV